MTKSTFTGKPVAWAVDGNIHKVDELKEAAISALETLESVMSEASFQKRFDILHNVVRTFAMLNTVIIEESKQRWLQDHPGEVADA
jgi:hypothetical protein